MADTNTLATVLDQDGGRTLVEKYIHRRFLERRGYKTVYARSKYGQIFKIPMNMGQYIQMTRKNRFRTPEKVPHANRTADPASGAGMGTVRLQLPLDYIHEYAGIGTVANWTSWIDLDEWVDEDLSMALQRREHQLTQNCMRVGRYLPGLWAADGSASVAFDTTIEATVEIDGASFTFLSAPTYLVGNKDSFTDLEGGDRHRMADYVRAKTRMLNGGARKWNGSVMCGISEAVKNDLMDDDKYFRTAILAWKGKGIAEGHIAKYRGIDWFDDDEPYTEDLGAEKVRATDGRVHTSFMMGKSAWGYVDLGKMGGNKKPKFKIQDITKTGGEKTVGYTVPYQTGVVDRKAVACITGPVSEWLQNDA